MTKEKHIRSRTSPWTPKDFTGMGIAMILMGVLVALVSISSYRHGSEAQIVNTKWGTEVMNETPAGSPFFLFLAGCGGAVSIGGVFLLGTGMLKKRKE